MDVGKDLVDRDVGLVDDEMGVVEAPERIGNLGPGQLRGLAGVAQTTAARTAVPGLANSAAGM